MSAMVPFALLTFMSAAPPQAPPRAIFIGIGERHPKEVVVHMWKVE